LNYKRVIFYNFNNNMLFPCSACFVTQPQTIATGFAPTADTAALDIGLRILSPPGGCAFYVGLCYVVLYGTCQWIMGLLRHKSESKRHSQYRQQTDNNRRRRRPWRRFQGGRGAL